MAVRTGWACVTDQVTINRIYSTNHGELVTTSHDARTDVTAAAHASRRTSARRLMFGGLVGSLECSLEVFTPRTAHGLETLLLPRGRLASYAVLGPSFVGVSGPPGDATLQLLERVKKLHSIRPMLHLARAEVTEEGVVALVDSAARIGVADVLVLGGAPGSLQPAAGGRFGCGAELVTFLKHRYGGRLRIAVCGYPRGAQGEAGDYEADLAQTSQQTAAGAECVICLPTFGAAAHMAYVSDARSAGVGSHVPILPGILPLCAAGEFRRVCRALHVTPPEAVVRQLDEATSEEATRASSRAYLQELVSQLREQGACAPHVYTLNAGELLADLAAAGLGPIKHRQS